MPDYGHDLRFGIFPTPRADRLDDVLELAQQADVLGLDYVTLQDHPYQATYADMWTLLSAIGARTRTVRLTPNVASLPLRPPVVLAKSAATLDLLTGGRVELALGTGAFWDAIAAAGAPRRTPGEAVDALLEAVEIIRGVWTGQGSVTVDGTHYRTKGLKAGPAPAHDIPIWLGAYKPRMLAITGRLADAWVPSMGYADPPDLADLNVRIDRAAEKAGRSPVDIRRCYNVFGGFDTGTGILQGPPHAWVEDLTELAVSEGMSTFILGVDDQRTLHRFAEEVVPSVRALVDVERGRSVAAAGTLSVRATPDDGVRLGDMPWSEEDRPSAPVPSEARYTEPQQAAAQHLVDIHDALRGELAQVRSLVDQVRTGHLSVGQARSVINTMTMRQNNWTLGAYCASYCRIVTGHHTLEDRSIFPHLLRAQPDLDAVLARLQDEHVVIHDVLERLDAALVAMVGDDGYGRAGRDDLDELGRAVDLLTDTLLSHLSYEERELIHPLATHGFG